MRRRKGLNINGVLLLDKPTSISSNDALQKVKRIYQATKAGHTGALDPLATGMLPLGFGEATKFSQFLLDSDKRYRVIARLGQRTDTSDSDGTIISERSVNITEAQLQQTLLQFNGKIAQIPSMYSALKYQGRPLYEYARQGITITREARQITIYDNKLIQFDNRELELEIHCSKGTYIRTIIDDLGELLGCGAHVIYLRRLQVGTFLPENMVTLETLQQIAEDPEGLSRFLLPMDSAVLHLQAINITEAQGQDIQLGRTITINPPEYRGVVRITVGPEKSFIGIGICDVVGKLSPKRLVVQY